MSHPVQATFTNRLLRALPVDSFARLAPHLEPIALPKGETIIEANVPIAWAYFPESGLASIVSRQNGSMLEVGVFGRDGMGSTALPLGIDRSLHTTLIQVEGRGHRVAAGVLRDALANDPALSSLLLRYVQCYSYQVAYTAISNATNSAEGRLARWLLLAHDRLQGDDLALTHEYLGVMLGVRRPSVTLATHLLEGAQAIRTRRGVIVVTDRAKLEALAGDAYGPAEAEYERLIGPLHQAE